MFLEKLHPLVPVLARPTHQFLSPGVPGAPGPGAVLEDVADGTTTLTVWRMGHIAWHYVIHVVADALRSGFGKLCFVSIPTRAILLTGSFCHQRPVKEGEQENDE